MYYVVDLESRRVVCYADGSRRTFINQGAALHYAGALQQNNPGVFNITSALDHRACSLGRVATAYGNDLKLREPI